MLSHSQSARRKEEKQNGQKDEGSEAAKQLMGVKGGGVHKWFCTSSPFAFCFCNHAFAQPPGGWVPRLRYTLIMQRAKKKKKELNRKTSDCRCATAGGDSRTQAEHRNKGMRGSNEASGETVQGSWRTVWWWWWGPGRAPSRE